MYLLPLLSTLIPISTCIIYTVTPDDHYYPNTTCHHCHNLQHYLLNVTKYFTSNTQPLFLPGLHHLHTDLIIQNVHNISLIGDTANGTALIQCMHSKTYITIVNVTLFMIRNLMIEISKLHAVGNVISQMSVTIKDCISVSLNHLKINDFFYENFIDMKVINIMGSSYFNNVTLPRGGSMKLLYKETYVEKHHILTLNNCRIRTMDVDMLQKSYKVTLKIINTLVQQSYDYFIYAKELGINEVYIINCRFISNYYKTQLFSLSCSSNGSVQFINCQFINNNNDYYYLQTPRHWEKVYPSLIKLYLHIKIELNNCTFVSKNPQTAGILQTYNNNATYTANIHVVIRNTNFMIHRISKIFEKSDVMFASSFITLSNTTLILWDSVTFGNITTPHSIISLKGNSSIIIFGVVEFSHNHVHDLINFYDNGRKYIIMKEYSVINVTNNDVWSLFSTSSTAARYPYPFCLFQYFSTNESGMTMKIKFLVKFYENQCKQDLRLHCYDHILATHCLWLPQSLFNNAVPLEVNSIYMQFVNKSGIYKLSQIIEQRSLCVCTDESHYDCHINDLGYLYPGQTLALPLHYTKANGTNAVVVKTDIHQQYITPCIVLDITEILQLIHQQCTILHYTVGFSDDKRCELFLKKESDLDAFLDIFYIWQLRCPIGFIKIDKRCQCDPVLVQYGITNCNINDQTILRPANSWISVTTHNNSYTYHISLHCPFHYCLSHQSHLSLSTTNSQCQFNRSGFLCGQCQQGLSSTFSSPHCQRCSNIYLLLIIPFAIAGLVLVLLLFVLNLTITDGTINGFILHANIISINTPVFFTELNHFTPTYTFISLANLELGTQTCFYNGMDDYAKMWLQLAFPFYLIFIATLIIITSRYSTTIQRLTARRALPVLATLFLLSYTKILHIVSSVLFFYSTITHLPSKHTTLVWSVDANVPLFGVRFTMLFIVCLILFLMLVPFNVILLFTRMSSRLKFVNQFKPLLDVYQGPYRANFNYWTGLQLMIRVMLFGVSSLDRQTNIGISIILISIIIGFHGTVQPFKFQFKNYQELIFFNLQALYVISLYDQSATSITVINIMFIITAFHFTCIIIYHIVTYVHSGVIRNNIQLMIKAHTRWVTRLYNKSQHKQFQLQGRIRDKIPEVAFNYSEYREPLVGQEYC